MTPPLLGEPQGTTCPSGLERRRVPHWVPPGPLSATPPSGSLCGVRVMKLAFSASFFCRENVLVLVGVFTQRFLIFKPLKTDNSATPQTISFLNGAFY